jgi:nitronate monooxygenase
MKQRPVVIQGGMGVAVSNWVLARAVSQCGQLGVVSGTALDQMLARRLQDGDPGGHMRRAMDRFPFSAMAQRVWDTYYVPGGKAAGRPYKPLPLRTVDSPRSLIELIVVGNFVEVWLARDGHDGLVGINYLEKIQIPHLPSFYGAMLAGVDYVLMGAGIPMKVPGALDRLANHELATYPIHVVGSSADDEAAAVVFDPREYMEHDLAPLPRPQFLAIISSSLLGQTLIKRANGYVDGFVVEGPTAGGHNAPPRGKPTFNDDGEPIYGERDVVDLEKMAALGRPFWMAGGWGTAAKLQECLAAGAAGIQVGTAFAFCEESGLRADYKRALLDKAIDGTIRVYTDPLASPTSFPFKVAQLDGTMSARDVYEARRRVCDLGYLREVYRGADGSLGYRCPSEPVHAYVSKGGNVAETVGRKCVCNGLMANAGHPQVRGASAEVGIVTAGDDLAQIARFLAPGQTTYGAADVIAHLLSGVGTSAPVRPAASEELAPA